MNEEKSETGVPGYGAPPRPGVADVQFVIEATSEKMDMRKKFSASWRWRAGPKTIVATNTSALPVSELAM